MEQLKNNNNSIYYMGCIYTQKYTNSVCKQWIARKVPSTFFFLSFFAVIAGLHATLRFAEVTLLVSCR